MENEILNDIKKNSIAARITDDGKLINTATGEPIDPSSVIKTADIYITEASATSLNEMATGIAIPTYRTKSWDYLKEVNDFKDVLESDIYKHIDVCNKLYRFEPIIGTSIDLFVDFSINSFKIVSDNEELNKIIEYLIENVNKFPSQSGYLFAYPSGLKALAKEIASEWFISGNVFPYTTWSSSKIDSRSYKLPNKIINLNPLSIKIDRAKEFLGAVKLTYSETGYYADSSGSRNNGTTINFNNEAKYTSNFNTNIVLNANSERPLDHTKVYYITRKYSGFRLWGLPYLQKVFSAVMAKRKLRYLDDATIDGLVNYIIVFKVGSPDKDSPYHKVSANRLAALKNLLSNPQASNMIVWPHDIDVMTVGPDGKVLEFKERYDTVNKDIVMSLGVPSALLDGSGGNVNMTWVSILALVERLEEVRDAVGNYFTYLVGQVAKENKLEFNTLKIKWGPSNLRDEKTIKTLLLAFYDRGLLPIETTLFHGNYDSDEMFQLMKDEKKKGIDKYFQRRDVPFSPINKGNLTRVGDQGRPVDNTKVNTKVNTSTTASIIIGKYKENILNEINTLYEDIKTIRKVDTKVEDKILGHFLRIKQISDIFLDMELKDYSLGNINENHLKEFYDWKLGYLDKIRESVKSNLDENLSYIRKENVANFVVAGVFANCKKELEEFCDNTLYAVSLMELFNENISLGAKTFYILNNGDILEHDIKNIFNKLPFNLKDIEFKFN